MLKEGADKNIKDLEVKFDLKADSQSLSKIK